jgi:hypothetical protein
MVRSGQPVFDTIGQADPVEAVHAGGGDAGSVPELQAVVGEHRVDLVRHCLDQVG